MKESVKCKLPDNFSLVFDWWTEGTEHFIGITASYMPKRADHVVTHMILSMRPLLADEINGMTACDHLHHLSKMLRQYGKTEANVVFLVGDNCNVNQCMSRLLKVPLLGCGSHKFNLAVRKWISNQPQLEETISKVVTVMKKASTPLKVSAQLRKLTSLQPVKENDTRWTSTFNMLERFFRIQAELSAVSDLIPWQWISFCLGFCLLDERIWEAEVGNRNCETVDGVENWCWIVYSNHNTDIVAEA